MRWLAAILAAALALSVGRVAHSQGLATVVTSCGSQAWNTTNATGQQQPLSQDPTGKLCISGAFSGTFNSSGNATATLPTLAPGSQTPQTSLAGANYIQPVYGSASGGGTQVDITHGLPVNIIAGSSAGSLADLATFTQGTTQAVPTGGIFSTSVTSLLNGQFGALRLTADRMLMGDMEKVAGTAVVTGGQAGLQGVGGPVASGATNGANPVKIGAPFNTAQPTVTNGQMVDLQSTAHGSLIVATGGDTFNVTVSSAVAAGSNTIGAVTQASGPWTGNTTQLGGTVIATGSGNTTLGTQRVILALDQPSLTTPLNVGSTTLATVAGQTGVQVAVNGGTAPASANLAGGVFHSAAPTLTNGQGAELQLDSAARMIISPTNLSLAQGSTTSGQQGSLVMGAVTTAAPTYVTTQTSPISLDTAGNVRTNCVTGCAASTFADNSAFTEGTTSFAPVGGEYVSGGAGSLTTAHAGVIQMTIDRMMYVNLGKVGGSAIALGQNTMANSLPVAIASNQFGQTTMAASLPVAIASNQATFPISITQTDVTANGVEIAPTAAAAAGIASVASTSVESGHIIKASAGNLYGAMIQTGATAGCWYFFNSTTVPGDGAVTPAMAPIEVAANSTVGVSFGSNGPPTAFSTGISTAFSSTCGLTKTASATALFSWSAK